MSIRSSPKAGRVVRHTLADGSIKTYRYGPYRGPENADPDTLEALMLSYERSPKWRGLKPSSQAIYTRYLRYLAGINHLLVKNIDRRSIMELRDGVALDRGDGAANTFMVALGALFAWALKRGWIEYSPCARIEPLKRKAYPTWSMAEIELALVHLREELRRAIILALYTGQRRGDVVHMTWADYDGATIRVCQEKTDVRLTLPCHRFLKQQLDAWKAEGVTVPTILKNASGRPWRASQISNAMCTALREVPGFPAGRNMHGLRKAAATMLAEAGATSHEIASVTGHKTLKEIERYTAAARQQVLAGAAVLRFPDLQTGIQTDKRVRKNG